MTTTNKLTIEDLERFIKNWPESFCDSDIPVRFAKQLADTMRENEVLTDLVKTAYYCATRGNKKISKTSAWVQMAEEALQRNKESADND